PKPEEIPRLWLPPIDTRGLRQEVEKPWAEEAPPMPDAPVLRVARSALLSPGQAFESLGAACAAAPAGKDVVIEIADNGPLHLAPFALNGRNVTLRASKGCRPLLVWDTTAPRPDPAARPLAFAAVAQGSLALEGLDFVVKWPDTPDPGCFFRLTDS